MDERGYMSREDYKKGTVREYGFTDERLIQDFPIVEKLYISTSGVVSGVTVKMAVSSPMTTI